MKEPSIWDRACPFCGCIGTICWMTELKNGTLSFVAYECLAINGGCGKRWR